MGKYNFWVGEMGVGGEKEENLGQTEKEQLS